jgi:hypothetical protein
LSEFQQLGDGCLFALRKGWAHIAIITHFTNNVDLFMRAYIANLFARTATFCVLPMCTARRGT